MTSLDNCFTKTLFSHFFYQILHLFSIFYFSLNLALFNKQCVFLRMFYIFLQICLLFFTNFCVFFKNVIHLFCKFAFILQIFTFFKIERFEFFFTKLFTFLFTYFVPFSQTFALFFTNFQINWNKMSISTFSHK